MLINLHFLKQLCKYFLYNYQKSVYSLILHQLNQLIFNQNDLTFSLEGYIYVYLFSYLGNIRHNKFGCNVLVFVFKIDQGLALHFNSKVGDPTKSN